jgi:hypothetical protein
MDLNQVQYEYVNLIQLSDDKGLLAGLYEYGFCKSRIIS